MYTNIPYFEKKRREFASAIELWYFVFCHLYLFIYTYIY